MEKQKQKLDHPFSGHKQQFQAIQEHQRSQFRKKILSLQTKEGQPKLFKKDYPKNQKWVYNNIELNYYEAKQVDDPKAVMFYFHGLNSHGNSSGYLGVTLAESCKINVYSLDFKNFGQSGGDVRGYISSFEQTCLEASSFVDFIMQKYKNKPKIIISGLSFGGGICFKLAIQNPKKYDYLIMFSPALREVKQSQFIMKKVGKAFGYLFPTLKIIQPTFGDGNKYKSEQRIRADKLNYTDKVVPGSIRTVLNSMQELQGRFSELSTPYLLVQSGADKLVDLFAPLDLQKKCKTNDKTTIYCKDMWHSVFSEQQIQHILPIVCEWVKKRL